MRGEEGRVAASFPGRNYRGHAQAQTQMDRRNLPDPDDFSNTKSNEQKPTVRLGEADVCPFPLQEIDDEEGGMVTGPNHPVFRPPPNAPAPSRQPPGARFDPITPTRPHGEPDNDELLPPGPPGDDPAQ